MGSGECWGNLKEMVGILYRGVRGFFYLFYVMEIFDKDYFDILSSL